ncbi:hypothetical protein N0V86_005119 [Didymella sp. IMI 355093]|nr:hypothetical protein N0V86_005119 [Didymella sp. IMI 355093]
MHDTAVATALSRSQLTTEGRQKTEEVENRLLWGLVSSALRYITALKADAQKEWETENKKLSGAAKAVEALRSSANVKTVTVPKSSTVKISVNIELAEDTPAEHSTTAPATPKSTTSKRKRDQPEPSRATTLAKRSKPRMKKEPQPSVFRGLAAVAAAGPGQDDITISGTCDIDIDWLLHPIFDVYADGPFALNPFTDEVIGI